jgi:hypothetical protein
VPAPERRRPVTTQEARQQARADGLLTPKGFDQGYVVLQPSRWLWRVWLELEGFNRALHRVEAETLVLLDSRQTDFHLHLDAFLAALADYRATTRRLTYHAYALASRRVKDLEKLTRQAVDAWRDDPSPPARGDDPPPDAGSLDAPSVETLAGTEPPSPVPDRTTLAEERAVLFGPSLAAARAAARAEEPA